MKLSASEARRFSKLYTSLLFYVNKETGVSKKVKNPEDVMELPIDKILKIREKLYRKTELIDSFVKENPFKFSKKDLEIIESWKKFIKGKFLVLRYTKNYAVFMSMEEGALYGVLSISSSFKDILGRKLPIPVETTLLPFKDKIVFDGFILPYNVAFGRSIKDIFNEFYKGAKGKIITSLR